MRVRGFTIVELLIVIVVIAILAAISVVAYNGIQQRANNAAIINAAQQTVKLIEAYRAANGSNIQLGGVCITADNACTNYMGTVVTTNNASLLASLRSVGEPVRSVPRPLSGYYGLYLDGYAPRTFNHEYKPHLLMYWLQGEGQNCQLPNIAVMDPNPLPGEQNAYMSATTPRTGSGNGLTTCYISV